MGKFRKDVLDLDFLPYRNQIKFYGPKKIGYFSIYFDRLYNNIYRPDKSSLKYLDHEKFKGPIDCLEGFDPETNACCVPGWWTNILRWIIENRTIVDQLLTPKKVIFVCTNSELKLLMLSPFDNFNWLVHAVKIGDFIHIFTGDNERVNPFRDNKLSYARFKLFRTITGRIEDRCLNSDYEIDMFNVVSFSQIGQHGILHSGEMEFVKNRDDADEPIDKAEFGALKIMQNVYGKRGFLKINNFRRLYWWSSALICGVETFIIGDIKDDFKIEKFDTIPVSQLDTKIFKKEHEKCLSSLDKTLEFIESQVTENNKVFDFRFNSNSKEITVLNSEKSFEEVIPSWFISGQMPDNQ